MGIGYFLGGVACLLYAILVGYVGGVKKSPGLIKLVKMKINKNMSDGAAAKISLVVGIIALAGGVFLFIAGAAQGAA